MHTIMVSLASTMAATMPTATLRLGVSKYSRLWGTFTGYAGSLFFSVLPLAGRRTLGPPPLRRANCFDPFRRRCLAALPTAIATKFPTKLPHFSSSLPALQLTGISLSLSSLKPKTPKFLSFREIVLYFHRLMSLQIWCADEIWERVIASA